jgi:hypothetical protein
MANLFAPVGKRESGGMNNLNERPAVLALSSTFMVFAVLVSSCSKGRDSLTVNTEQLLRTLGESTNITFEAHFFTPEGKEIAVPIDSRQSSVLILSIRQDATKPIRPLPWEISWNLSFALTSGKKIAVTAFRDGKDDAFAFSLGEQYFRCSSLKVRLAELNVETGEEHKSESE